jgi:hypothetical protein
MITRSKVEEDKVKDSDAKSSKDESGRYDMEGEYDILIDSATNSWCFVFAAICNVICCATVDIVVALSAQALRGQSVLLTRS